MKKTILSAVAISLFSVSAALAQTTPTTSDGGDKTKQVVDGMTVKTKVDPSDGKMKVKGKDEQGNRMKAYTKPRKGEGKMDRDQMKADRKAMKGMRKDSTSTSGTPSN